jgi:hypothetical protein
VWEWKVEGGRSNVESEEMPLHNCKRVDNSFHSFFPTAAGGRSMTIHLRKVLATDSGMFAVWERTGFAHIVDYDSWEKELLEDANIARHIKSGALVPIDFGSDGVCEFELRVGGFEQKAALTSRERDYLTVSSALYRLRSSGTVCLSGIEYIGRELESEGVGVLEIPAGEYAVTVHMIAWDGEPGAKDAQGNPGPNALPDFVVLANPTEHDEMEFSISLETFSRRALPGASRS